MDSSTSNGANLSLDEIKDNEVIIETFILNKSII